MVSSILNAPEGMTDVDILTQSKTSSIIPTMADNLWRDCVAWLIQCKVIPSDHKANWPDSELKILAITLRDGVILCHLINFLDPTCLENIDFHRKPQMAQVRVCQSLISPNTNN